MHKTRVSVDVAPEAPTTAIRREEEAPSVIVTDGLANQFEVLRQALPKAMGMVDDLRVEFEREDGLRRELDLVLRALPTSGIACSPPRR